MKLIELDDFRQSVANFVLKKKKKKNKIPTRTDTTRKEIGKSSNLFRVKQGDGQEINRYTTDSSIFNMQYSGYKFIENRLIKCSWEEQNI